MAPQLIDNHGRVVNYLRLAVTDRCNLRCFYCMPEEGITYLPKAELMTYEEMVRIVRIMAGLGVDKVRITGGEPFVRTDIVAFMYHLRDIPGIKQLNLTTNGTLTYRYIDDLVKLGVKTVNLSLDTLDKDRFFQVTRRDGYDKVMQTFHTLLERGIQLKINMVVMQGVNTEDIIPIAQLAAQYPVDVRFIEEMPFNGAGDHHQQWEWNFMKIIDTLRSAYPALEKLPDPPHSTSMNYSAPGLQGRLGIIAAYTRSFCGTCNRLRLTPQGVLKTCLYDNGVFNIKDLLRNGATDEQVRDAIVNAASHRSRDGHEAEQNRLGLPVNESMSTIGG